MSTDKQNSDNSENPLIQFHTTDWNKKTPKEFNDCTSRIIGCAIP